MSIPKNTKYKKAFKGRLKGVTRAGAEIAYGVYGLKALEPERVTEKQIEAARRAISRHMQRKGRVWIRIFPDLPVSSKPAEVRMGRGKGAVEYWAARVHPGRILFEVDGVSREIAIEALIKGSHKLPVKVKVVMRNAEAE